MKTLAVAFLCFALAGSRAPAAPAAPSAPERAAPAEQAAPPPPERAALAEQAAPPPPERAAPAEQAVAPGSAPTVESLIRAYDLLTLGPAAASVSDLQLSSGHLSVVLKSGTAAAVMAGAETVGLFFQGQGTLSYVSVDPIEYPVMAFNVKKATGLRMEKTDKLTIREDFDTLLFMAEGRPLPELKGGAGVSLAKALADHRARFLRDSGSLASHQLALRKLNAPASPFVRAEFSGGKENLVYVFDPARNHSETLYALQRTGSEDAAMRNKLAPIIVSDQPIDRDRKDPPSPNIMLGEVDYTLVASGGKDATLSMKQVIVPVAEGQRLLRFDLYNTTYAVVGVGKLEPRFFHVQSVTDGRGRALSFHHENDELLVDLGAAPPAKQPLEIRFEIAGDFLIRPGGDNYWELGVEPWFPQPDLVEQAYTVHSIVKVQKPFVPFAPGTTVARRTEGDYNVVENKIDQPVQFVVVLAGKYEFSEETRGGVTVRVASYAGRNEPAWKKLTNLAYGIMEYYQNFLGPFPFPEFNIIEINEFGYGQAPPGTMFITQEAFQSQIGELNQIFSKGINERFAHEIAHQYWAHVVKMPSLEEQWLTESFAEYSAGLFIKKYEGKSTFSTLVATWKSNAKESTDASPIPLANRIRIKDDRLRAFITRTHLIYDKGAYLLSRIHAGMDDKDFLTFLKSYQKNFRWKFGTTKHVAGLLQFLTKKDYGPFFEANYWGTGMPE